MEKKIMYWIYKGNKVLTGVSLYPGATYGDVIGKAVADHARVPLHHEGYTPEKWDGMLRAGKVCGMKPETGRN